MITIVRNILGCLFFHLLPKKYLERWLNRKLSASGYYFHGRFSGRSALLELADVMRKESSAPVALYPEYVCNIVPKALAKAGWIVESYKVDEKLEANPENLIDRIRQGDVGLLVGASVFGSSGLLDDLCDRQKLSELRTLGVQVIADIAQDIRLVQKLPEYGNDLISAIVSFNDKSFSGAMGGGIITNIKLPDVQNSINRKLLLSLYKSYFLKNVKVIKTYLCPNINTNKRKAKGKKFEYSGCDKFPFRLQDNYRITKLQLACAAQGLSQLKQYDRIKQRFLNKNIHVETRFASSSAYLLINQDAGYKSKRKPKHSYSIEGNPDASLKPNELILHNKGFDDFI